MDHLLHNVGDRGSIELLGDGQKGALGAAQDRVQAASARVLSG